MYQSNHMINGSLNIDMSQYLRRHDIVYNTPALDGYNGLPIGNGKSGGLIYHTANSLIYGINHTDAIDFASDGQFKAWAWESEEKNTAPFSCGNVKVISSQPIFDWVYLERFEERLNLADACLTGCAITPFSEIQYKIYAAEEPNIIVMEFHLEQEEPVGLNIRIEKWSTPNFFHHYEQIVRVHDKGLKNTSSYIQGNIASVCHDAGRLSTALSACVTDVDNEVVRCTSHTCEIRLSSSKTIDFKLYLSAEVAEDAKTAVKCAAKNIKRAISKSPYDTHVKSWHAFWSRSFVHIEDDYIENLYYIHLYQLNACGRGKYPPLFGGLWTWFGDARNWGHFYHWNNQQTYWGIYAAGHPKLADNYLTYRFDMLQSAIFDAKAWHGAEGAFFSDISNLNGFNALEPDTLRNFSVGAQIAMDFYRHYQYTRNDLFLTQKVIPMMLQSMRLYSSLLEKDEDDRYRIKGGSTAYESYWNLRETLTDYAAIHALLKAIFYIEDKMGLSSEEATHYRDIQENLYQYATVHLMYHSKEIQIFSAGQKWDKTPVEYGEGEYPLSPFPATLFSMVYPSGIVGLAQKDEPIYKMACNTARVLFDNEVYKSGKLGCSGHAPAPQMAARLGMGEDVWKIIRQYVKTYQLFPNGLMHFADISKNQQWAMWDKPRILSSSVTDTQWDEIHDKTKGLRTRISSKWFLHCYFEAAANILDGIHEALLQSHDGIIRVFPAMGGMANALFKLWAVGGFVVTAEKSNHNIQYILIESKFGEKCMVENPWLDEKVHIKKNGRLYSYCNEGDIICFDTDPGAIYLIYRAEYPLENNYSNRFENIVNTAPKHHGNVQIGLDKIY